jgi:hypothetical protein
MLSASLRMVRSGSLAPRPVFHAEALLLNVPPP